MPNCPSEMMIICNISRILHTSQHTGICVQGDSSHPLSDAIRDLACPDSPTPPLPPPMSNSNQVITNVVIYASIHPCPDPLSLDYPIGNLVQFFLTYLLFYQSLRQSLLAHLLTHVPHHFRVQIKRNCQRMNVTFCYSS